MKKIILSIAFIATGLVASAQVGVGTTNPLVSLQVDKSSVVTEADGVLVPRVSVEELNTKSGAYVGDQNGTLVFINDLTGTAAGKTSNVTATGFHYYNSVTSKWTCLGCATAPTLNYLLRPETANFAVSASNDVIEYTGASNTEWTLPASAPVGKIFYIVCLGGNNSQITFPGIVTGIKTLTDIGAFTLVHIGGGRYITTISY